MKIQELFVKPIDRPIDGVIKADDDRNLKTEIEEYVVTAEVSRVLDRFTECYLDEPNANGVWISGFFGSGKSHLLKMLALMLDSQKRVDGVRPIQILLPKIEDQVLRGNLQRAAKIPAQSILFNIDQKSDSIGGDRTSPVLEVFIKVLNEAQGYYAKQGHIAQFEYELDRRGELDAFKDAYAKASGSTWQADLPVLEVLENETFAKVYAAHFKKSYTEGLNIFDRLRATYKVSIESFAQRVKEYIDKQAPGFRLNFFVDEAGQFIGQNSSLMLNLQTITETLSTVCNGRAWVFVTSQGDLKSVLGEMKGSGSTDFSKIQGRFKTHLTLSSADVREVIQRRLLAKHEAEPLVLTDIYDREKDNLQTLFRFSDESRYNKGWRGSDEFCNLYPFVPYQFDLFQAAVQQLSSHDAFTGKYASVGERSMLAVFQEVAKQLRDIEIGNLATFDLMYDGIATTLRGNLITTLQQSARQLSNPMAVRILKVLFVLKWVKEFKPTPRNIAILLIDQPNIPIQQHEKDVREALNRLEQLSYLQRNGDTYEFLTDIEKDIEKEIKNTEIETAAHTKLLHDILFGDILGNAKIRYQHNEQDYAYARKLDEQVFGKEADIAIHIITPDHEHHDNMPVLRSQTMGKRELLVVLAADDRLIDDSRLFLKTQKYIQQNTSGTLDETRRAVLTIRGSQNSARRMALRDRCSALLGKAALYLNAAPILLPEGEARNRIAKGCQELIAFAYPQLKMLKGSYNDETLSKALLQPSDLLNGDITLSEAEQEVLTYVTRNQNNAERTHVEEMVRQFERQPYGWPMLATLTQLARLFRSGKIEVRDGELLEARALLEALKNTRQQGSLRVHLQVQFDAGQVAKLKRFYADFFDRVNEANDPRTVAQNTRKALLQEHQLLTTLYKQQQRYPFLQQLQPILGQIDALAAKDDASLFSQLDKLGDPLLDAKEDVLTPIKGFMNGPQRQSYDEVVTFYREQEANFSHINATDLGPIRALVESNTPFRGNGLPTAKNAMLALQQDITSQLQTEQQKALSILDEHEAKLKAAPECAALNANQREQVLQASQRLRQSIRTAGFISAIRDQINRYRSDIYPQQMSLLHQLAAPPPAAPLPTSTGKAPSTQAKPAPAPAITFMPASQLQVACNLSTITTETDLDTWLAAVRSAALAELKRGKRLTL